MLSFQSYSGAERSDSAIARFWRSQLGPQDNARARARLRARARASPSAGLSISRAFRPVLGEGLRERVSGACPSGLATKPSPFLYCMLWFPQLRLPLHLASLCDASSRQRCPIHCLTKKKLSELCSYLSLAYWCAACLVPNRLFNLKHALGSLPSFHALTHR